MHDKRVGSFTSPANPNVEDAGDEAYGLYSLSRKPERLTIFRYNYKGSTFSAVVLRPWALVRPAGRPSARQSGALPLS